MNFTQIRLDYPKCQYGFDILEQWFNDHPDWKVAKITDFCNGISDDKKMDVIIALYCMEGEGLINKKLAVELKDGTLELYDFIEDVPDTFPEGSDLITVSVPV